MEKWNGDHCNTQGLDILGIRAWRLSALDLNAGSSFGGAQGLRLRLSKI